MLRKLILALAAGATLTAFAPVSACAHWHGGWGHHYPYSGPVFLPGIRVFSPPAYAGYDSCWRRRWWVAMPFGMRLRWANVCAY